MGCLAVGPPSGKVEASSRCPASDSPAYKCVRYLRQMVLAKVREYGEPVYWSESGPPVVDSPIFQEVNSSLVNGEGAHQLSYVPTMPEQG